MTADVIVARSVSLARAGTPVLRDISLSLATGETIGFLGADGSGKTTLFRILACVLPPPEGTVVVNGLDVREYSHVVRAHVGYGPETPPKYPEVAGEFLRLWAAAGGMSRGAARAWTSEMLERYGLSERGADRIEDLTTYEQRLLYLAVANASDAPILILDNPMAGLDPAMRTAFLAHLSDLKAQDKTMLIATSELEDIRSISDRIVTMSSGRATPPVPTDLMLASVGRARHARVFVQVEGARDIALETIRSSPGVLAVEDEPEALIAFVDPAVFRREQLEESLQENGVVVTLVRESRLAINDIFRTMSKTGFPSRTLD